MQKTKKEIKYEKFLKHALTKGFYNKQVKKLEKECDVLWSLAVRNNCKCELCGQVGDIKSFDAHHIRGRAHKATRHDLDNGACLCKGCHRYKIHTDTFTVGALIERLKERRGLEWWKQLNIKSCVIWKPTLKDIEKIKEELTKLI